jgi:hypothetical protein
VAHHNNTPRRVLDAPVSRPRWVVRHVGMSRAERRHRVVTTEPQLVTFFDKTWRLLPAINVAHRVGKAPSRRDLHRAAVRAARRSR